MKAQLSTALEYRRRVCLAMNFISENLDRELSVEEIARIASFSMFHFHRIFKAVVGETVSEFTRRIRLEAAANRLMAERSEAVTEIAFRYGFSSSQNFARAFRVHFGVSPSGFRMRRIGNKMSNPGNALSMRVTYSADMVLNNQPTQERRQAMHAKIMDLPEYRVAYLRKLGAYGKETCEQAFGELMHWAGPKGLIDSGTMIGVYWDNPEVTPPEKCRVDACISVPPGMKPEKQIDIQTITGGRYAVCRFELMADNFQSAWDEAFRWIVQNGHECDDRPCYERYHSSPENHPEGKWVFDICIPLEETHGS